MVSRDPRRVPRRVNAPIRTQRRRVSSVPDLLISFAIAGWTMSVVFLFASYGADEITSSDAGPILARMFAAALAASAAFVFVIALALLRDERNEPSHYTTPGIVGIIVGGLVSIAFLEAAGWWIFVPFAFFVFALRPMRRAMAHVFGRRGG